MATAMKKEVIPLQYVLELTLNRTIRVTVMEDNTHTISAATKGYSASLRHLARTQRIAVGVFGEMFGPSGDGSYRITHCVSEEQKGDIFTKRLGRIRFEKSQTMLSLVPMFSCAGVCTHVHSQASEDSAEGGAICPALFPG